MFIMIPHHNPNNNAPVYANPYYISVTPIT